MSLRTLNRYIGREFFKMWALCLVSFYMLFLLVDFIERSRHLFKHGGDFSAIILYFAYKSPMIIYMMVPVATLLGALLTLAILSKYSEVTAMKAGGVSVVRAVAPIIALASIISLGTFLMNEYIVPTANQKAAYIYKTGIKKQKWKAKYKKRDLWYKSHNAIYKFDLFVPEQEKIKGISVYRFDDQFRLQERVEAESAQYYDDQWHLIGGVKRGFVDGELSKAEPFNDLVFDIPETPEDMKVYQIKPDEMSYRQLRAYVAKLEKEGYDPTKYKVDMHGKLSFPLVSIIMAILGIPFAIRHGREGGVAAGIGIAVVLGVVYWIALSMMLAFGRSGTFPPVVSAWGSHVLFGGIGIYMMYKMEK